MTLCLCTSPLKGARCARASGERRKFERYMARKGTQDLKVPLARKALSAPKVSAAHRVRRVSQVLAIRLDRKASQVPGVTKAIPDPAARRVTKASQV